MSRTPSLKALSSASSTASLISSISSPASAPACAAFVVPASFAPRQIRTRSGSLDVSAAEAAPGVVLVMTYRNAPRMQPMPLFMTAPKAAGGISQPLGQSAGRSRASVPPST